jgi:hypothetical protein
MTYRGPPTLLIGRGIVQCLDGGFTSVHGFSLKRKLAGGNGPVIPLTGAYRVPKNHF